MATIIVDKRACCSVRVCLSPGSLHCHLLGLLSGSSWWSESLVGHAIAFGNGLRSAVTLATLMIPGQPDWASAPACLLVIVFCVVCALAFPLFIWCGYFYPYGPGPLWPGHGLDLVHCILFLFVACLTTREHDLAGALHASISFAFL